MRRDGPQLTRVFRRRRAGAGLEVQMTWYQGKTWREISVLFPSLASIKTTVLMSAEDCNRVAEVAALCRIAAAAEKIAAWMDPNARRLAIKQHAEQLAIEKRWTEASAIVEATFGKHDLPVRWRRNWELLVGKSIEVGLWHEHRHDLVGLARWARGHVRSIGVRSMEKLVEQATAVGGVAKDPAAAAGAQA